MEENDDMNEDKDKDKDKDKNKKVTIYIIQADEGSELDQEPEQESDPDPDPDPDPIKRPPTPVQNTQTPHVPISERFQINRGKPITDLKSLITAFNHPNADKNQIELVCALKELDSMIGMTKFKDQIINQILFFVQDLHDDQTFLHTVITGEPGTGKSRLISILAKIYCKIGILPTDNVVVADRADLIGKWLGNTAIKTKKVLESAKGGILLIDEVYALGNKGSSSDTFSKECIDTLNQYLSEHVNEFICVIAGYTDLVNECFFAANPGLERRFPWRFTIDPYKSSELMEIMKLQICSCGWKLGEDITDKYLTDIIHENKQYFSGNGGDTKNLIDKCKIANARRMFTNGVGIGVGTGVGIGVSGISIPKKRKAQRSTCAAEVKNRIFAKIDIEKGLNSFIDSKTEMECEEEMPISTKMMYV